jgi:hypothetical protein
MIGLGTCGVACLVSDVASAAIEQFAAADRVAEVIRNMPPAIAAVA